MSIFKKYISENLCLLVQMGYQFKKCRKQLPRRSEKTSISLGLAFESSRNSIYIRIEAKKLTQYFRHFLLRHNAGFSRKILLHDEAPSVLAEFLNKQNLRNWEQENPYIMEKNHYDNKDVLFEVVLGLVDFVVNFFSNMQMKQLSLSMGAL